MNQDTIYKIETDPNYAIAFAVDNNPEGINKGLVYHGYNQGDREYMISVLTSLAKNGGASVVKDILNDTPYNNNADNYTAGMLDYFAPVAQNQSYATASRFDLTAFLGALGSGLSTYSNISGGASGVIYPSGQLPAQPSWFSRNWIWVLLTFVVLVFSIIVYKKIKNKK
jgi:hypothetical protein